MHYSAVIVSLLASSAAASALTRCRPGPPREYIDGEFTLEISVNHADLRMPLGLGVEPFVEGGEMAGIVEEKRRQVLSLTNGLLRGVQGPNQGLIAGFPRQMDKTELPKRLVFHKEDERQPVYFQAVEICDEEGELQLVVRVDEKRSRRKGERSAQGILVPVPEPGKSILITLSEERYPQNVELIVTDRRDETSTKKMKNVQVAVQVEM